MMIRMARESDAQAMGRMMVATFLAAHRNHMSTEAWEKRVREWTPEVSARGWAETLRDIAIGDAPHECLYVAEDEDGAIVGLAMGGPADNAPTHVGAVNALYIDTSHQGLGLGRQLLQAVATHLAQVGFLCLQIGCVAANVHAQGFYTRMGGRVIGERLFDEDGTLLPELIYEWADITLLVQR